MVGPRNPTGFAVQSLGCTAVTLRPDANLWEWQVGFDVERTFLFKDTDAIHDLYPNVLRIQVGPSLFLSRSTFTFG